ncbi:cytochrome c oxidase subunit CcoM [Saccharospirillum sp. MSK14-1]|nr:cytochrome c oxidase subunit CcoM [Saccharospirillum sp. MSK14-1]
MYVDTVVIAGLLTVGLMFAFFGGIAWVVRKDLRTHPENGPSEDAQERR